MQNANKSMLLLLPPQFPFRFPLSDFPFRPEKHGKWFYGGFDEKVPSFQFYYCVIVIISFGLGCNLLN